MGSHLTEHRAQISTGQNLWKCLAGLVTMASNLLDTCHAALGCDQVRCPSLELGALQSGSDKNKDFSRKLE